MAKASELLSKLERTSRRNDLVSAIAYNILERTKCDPNLLEVEFKDLDNDNPIFATFTYTFINGDDESIVWEEDQDPDKTIDDDFNTMRYQRFIADIINDVCDRQEAKKKAQEELDRRAAVILFRQYVEKLTEEFRKTGRCRELIEEPKPMSEPKSNPILTQSRIEAIEKAGGIAIPDDEEVLVITGGMGGRISAIRNEYSRWYPHHYNCYNDVVVSSGMPIPIEALAIPDEKIIAVFPTPDGNGPVYITAPRGDEFWHHKTTFVYGDKKISNLWLAICDGPRCDHDCTLPTRSAICLAIEAASDGDKNCSGYA